MSEPTIFTQIINGDIPSHKVYEDGRTLAFMNIYPVLPYHVLVIPKHPAQFVWDLPDEEYRALMDAVKKVALRIREVSGLPYVHERVVGVDVPHAHVHLMPFTYSSELRQEPDIDGEPDHTKLSALAKTLAF